MRQDELVKMVCVQDSTSIWHLCLISVVVFVIPVTITSASCFCKDNLEHNSDEMKLDCDPVSSSARAI